MITYWDRGCEWMGDGLQLAICPSFTGATSTIALDVSGNANHGTLTNMDRNAAWVASGGYGALSFDGVNDQVPTACPGITTSRRSCAVWFNSSVVLANAQYAPLLRWGTATTFPADAGKDFSVQFGNDANFGSTGLGISQYGDGFGVTGFNDGRWHFGYFESIGSVYSIYIDGIFRASKTMTTNATAGVVTIGQTYGTFYNGQLDDIRVYNRTLTASQIVQMYELGRGGGMLYRPPIRRYETLLANAYTLIAASASYSITGQPVGLLAGRLLAADAASYLLAGNATGLNAGRLLTADSAAYALTGQDANLLAGRLLSGDTATYNLVGNAANLLASRTLQANSAQYTVTGSDAALLAGRLLDCGSSAFLLSPNQAGLLAARKLTADQASLLLTTQATNLYAGRKITAETAQFILIASPVDLTFGGGGAAPYYYLFLLGGSR